MKEKDFLKKVTDLNMPDKELVRQRIISNKSKVYKNRRVKKLILATSCLFALVFSLMIMPEFQNKLTGKENPSLSTNEFKNNNIVINKIDRLSDDKANIAFDSETTYEKYLSVEDVIKYLGKDIRPKVLPEGLQDYLVINPDYKFKVIYNNDEKILLDEFILSYKEDFNSEEYNPLEKMLTITASRESNTKDYIFFSEEEMKKSEIQGLEVMIGKGKMSYGPYTEVEDGPNIPAGYYDLYVAEFIIDDIKLEVVADNFTEDEFINVLMSIIKQ